MCKVLVLGFFDGVHVGHQLVLRSAVEAGDDVTLITLNESPSIYFGNEKEYLFSRENSMEKIKALGINVETEVFSNIVSMSASEYIERLINIYSPKIIVTGFNYTFGYKKSGDSKMLDKEQEKYGYKYICVPPCIQNGEIVSSTLIKKYLKEGNIKTANNLIGSPFILDGTVKQGSQIGRTIGFPTANIEYPSGIVKIPFGVYYVKCLDCKGVMNYGIKPTIEGMHLPIAEVHLIGFEGNLYDKNIHIEVLDRIRSEKKFANLDDLKLQIEEDTKKCLVL